MAFQRGGHDQAVGRVGVEVRERGRPDSDLAVHGNLDEPLLEQRRRQEATLRSSVSLPLWCSMATSQNETADTAMLPSRAA